MKYIYIRIHKMYNQQIDDHISKGYTEDEEEEEEERKTTKEKKNKNCSAHCMTTYIQSKEHKD